MEESEFCSGPEYHFTGQEGLVRERGSQSEDASVDQTSLPSSLGSSRRVQERSRVSPMPRDQEDSDQREPTESEPPSPSESRMTQGNVLSEEPSPRLLTQKKKLKRKLSISHPRFRDSSLTRGLEERCSIRDPRKDGWKATRDAHVAYEKLLSKFLKEKKAAYKESHSKSVPEKATPSPSANQAKKVVEKKAVKPVAKVEAKKEAPKAEKPAAKAGKAGKGKK